MSLYDIKDIREHKSIGIPTSSSKSFNRNIVKAHVGER